MINPFSADNELILRINEQTFTLNGESFQIDPGYGTTPVLRQGRAFLPVRFLTEAVGGTIHWESSSNKVWVSTARTQLELTIGSAKALVNGEERILDSAPFVTGSRTMLPFRFIAEGLGFDVSWNDQTKEIKLMLSPKGRST